MTRHQYLLNKIYTIKLIESVKSKIFVVRVRILEGRAKHKMPLCLRSACALHGCETRTEWYVRQQTKSLYLSDSLSCTGMHIENHSIHEKMERGGNIIF